MILGKKNPRDKLRDAKILRREARKIKNHTVSIELVKVVDGLHEVLRGREEANTLRRKHLPV
jgi:hypothetical protein